MRDLFFYLRRYAYGLNSEPTFPFANRVVWLEFE